MMIEHPQTEELFSMYLLGELPEDDLARLEELLFADDGYYDQLLIAEDELRYDYAQGLLDPERRERFEKRLAAFPGDRQALAFAVAFVSELSALSASSEPYLEPAQTAPPMAEVPPVLFGVQQQNTLSPRHLLTQTTRAIARFRPGSLRLPRIKVSAQPLPAPIAEVVEVVQRPDVFRAPSLTRQGRVAF